MTLSHKWKSTRLAGLICHAACWKARQELYLYIWKEALLIDRILDPIIRNPDLRWGIISRLRTNVRTDVIWDLQGRKIIENYLPIPISHRNWHIWRERPQLPYYWPWRRFIFCFVNDMYFLNIFKSDRYSYISKWMPIKLQRLLSLQLYYL